MSALKLHRRRLLQIAGAAAVMGSPSRASETTATWRGRALGAEASIRISGLSQDEAAPLFSAIADEIERLEEVFSLYRASSQLSRLNATGRIAQPAPDLIDVLALSAEMHAASDGAFDPTIQTLWRKRAAAVEGELQAPGFNTVEFGESGIFLGKPETALTLNGIAQGYISDKVARLMRAANLRSVLVDTGEIVGIGNRPDGTAWRAGVAAVAGRLVARTRLSDQALATSSPFGTRVAKQGHILEPRTGRTPHHWDTVAIRHESAAIADAVSTAASLLPEKELNAFIAKVPGAELIYAG